MMNRRIRIHCLGRLLTAVAMIATLLAGGAVPATADAGPRCEQVDGDHVCTGHIEIGTPVGSLGSASELSTSFPCMGFESPIDGFDGDWIELPPDTERHAARLDFESVGDADLGVMFFREGCAATEGWEGGMYEAPRNRPEIGFIPQGSRFAAVNALEGMDIDFTFTVYTSRGPVFQPRADVEDKDSELMDFEVASDGATLKGHIHKPEDATDAPIVLTMDPYWNASPLAGPSSTLPSDYQPFINAGFAVALVNLRGSGLSEGECFGWGNPQDVRDVGAVIEALAAKGSAEGWGNGSVGMYGLSFGAWSGMMGVAAQAQGLADSLKSVIAASPVIDPWNNNTLRGAPVFPQTFHVGKAVLATGTSPERTFRPGCVTNEGNLEESRETPPVWNGDRDAFYEEIDLRPKIAGSSIPVLATSGIIPPSLVGGHLRGEGHILQFEGLWELLGGNERLVLGQHGHVWPFRLRPDLRDQMVQWFDHYLRGGPMVVEPGVVEYQDNWREWLTAAHWPPAEAETRWLLSEGSLVEHEYEVEASERAFVGVGAPCMRICVDEFDYPLQVPTSLPAPGSPACLPNHVAYVSPPLRADTEMAGNFRIDLTLESTLPDGNLVVYLIESETGECSDKTSTIIARAVTDLRHIEIDGESREKGGEFPVNEEANVSVLSLPFAARVTEGRRLVIAVGGDGREVANMPEHSRPVITVHTGANAASALWLPVLSPPQTAPLEVAIDIKPGSDDNPVSARGRGSIPVAILTTGSFDALTIDVTSVSFGPGGASATRSGAEDIDGDGDLDLMLHFEQSETGLTSTHTEACLTGSTTQGRAIRGCDRVTVR